MGISAPPMDEHDDQINHMQDALSALRGMAGSNGGPMMGQGAGMMLPPDLASPAPSPGQKAARKHISKLHKSFKALRKGKEK
jgi:hypothetical protein